jgi:hypothetical protein
MISTVALLDACVLFSAPLRDLMMRMAIEGVYTPKWTDLIHQEWINNLSELRPDLSPDRLKRTRILMDTQHPDATIADFESLIPTLQLPDENDRHVLAAAITGECDLIVTFNLKDFPENILSAYGIIAIHPDDFVLDSLQQVPVSTITALKQQQEALRFPPCSMEEMLATLERCGLPKTVELLRLDYWCSKLINH